MHIYDPASELNELSRIYLDENNDFSDARRKQTDSKYDPINLTIDEYDYTNWFEKGRIR